MSNTIDRICDDLRISEVKEDLMGLGSVDREDHSHVDWLKMAYSDTLENAKHLKRALDTIGTGMNLSAEKKAVDILLQVDASINTNIGIDSTVDERVAFKMVSNLILQKCKELDPVRFAIPTRPQGY